ncbi:hypothetical protein MNEG_16447 [Monoraphidium neglectum]|uniref:Peptidase M11 gametolysin domain-containing protein n=1 Tax=Monoraphidium neglectum TaxID=145388 RepID=A0A0D2IU73_9CHLO|nr:hypothetical protein MNEG_16447 [Monoraphidium neglectum]KIY91517.1 hypothetical protein MNEG_16447 [Monoraphidium neglectum]|eukprot:XP_013890537.1 hypothetical protein MNEG_16447 [Monoraphidium neglectum]
MQKVEGAIWSGLPHSQNTTVESMMKGCSFGMGSVSLADGGHLLRVVVPIPCKGTTPEGTKYNSKECPFPEWSDVANEWIKVNRQDVKLSDWRHKIYIVVKGETCGWGGMGYVGCEDDCRVWINGELWNEPDTYFHELGHNLFLNHAGKWGNDGYDDMSGAMGYCCDIRCHNAPHAHQVGWAAPIATLTSDTLPAGTWKSFELPAAALDPKNFVRIWPDWDKKGAKSKIYLQYNSANEPQLPRP